jgi:GNAT superfamily N-acetyltransferase
LVDVTEVRIEEAHRVPWADVEASLTHGGNGSSCWCQWPVNPAYSTATREQKHDALEGELKAAKLAPAFVAYVDDKPAGWCRVGPRTSQPRLLKLNVVRRGSAESLDDPTVWAVSCFVIRREFRGQGIGHKLLGRAVEFGREHGARVIEGYAVDEAERPNSPPSNLYSGTVRLFSALGFTVGSRPSPGRATMVITF